MADYAEFGLPQLIQGGMGVGVSNYRLARAVSQAGHLGVVSGTAIDMVLARRLQDGDPDGDVRSAMAEFPIPEIAVAVLKRYYLAGGRDGRAYRGTSMHSHRELQSSQDLLVLAAFVEVCLARRGHSGAVGINLLTKVQIPTVPTLFGAMLAGVDYVLMGAGIPRDIPGVLDRLAQMQDVETLLDVAGSTSRRTLRFSPARFGRDQELTRPSFLAIVSSHVLATVLARKASGDVNGFIVEAPVAGGHNAPPRGQASYDKLGQPQYGERDRVDLSVMRELGVPFWLAGGMDAPHSLGSALALGAAGIQVGTLFAFCDESGITADIRRAMFERLRSQREFVLTSARASSTGYPFKVASLAGTLSEEDVYQGRARKCDLGYLREAYSTPAGTIGYRCAAEPVTDYVAKGGLAEDTVGRLCLCNGLSATVGLGQVRQSGPEPAVITSGDGLGTIRHLLGGRGHYSAADVVAYLNAGVDRVSAA